MSKVLDVALALGERQGNEAEDVLSVIMAGRVPATHPRPVGAQHPRPVKSRRALYTRQRPDARDTSGHERLWQIRLPRPDSVMHIRHFPPPANAGKGNATPRLS